jgi:hypothetical protein
MEWSGKLANSSMKGLHPIYRMRNLHNLFQSVDRRLGQFCCHTMAVPLFLLLVTIMAHGLLIPWLGYYSDDWLFIWTGQKLGSAGLTRYFTTNRPVLGLLYQATMPLLGSHPLAWHLFGLFSRWVSALTCWWMLSLADPAERRRVALWTALLLLVYPGFKLTPVPITFGHMFLIMAVFFTSLGFTLLAERRPARFTLYTVIALLLSALNLLAMEYFFMLELARPLLLLLANTDRPFRHRLRHTIGRWIPYLLVFLALLVWRAFFFPYQTENYSFLFFNQLRSVPLAAIIGLVQMFFRDLFVALVQGWGNIFTELPLSGISNAFRVVFTLLVLTGGSIGYLGLRAFLRNEQEIQPSNLQSQSGWWSLTVGWLALAGLPFLLTGLKVQSSWIYSRFTMPYILGTALVIALALNSRKLFDSLKIQAWIPQLIMCGLIGLSLGNQFLNANQFRKDWKQQQALYWQIAWRFPALRPGTTLVLNEQHSYSGSTTYLTAAVNWLFAPDNRTARTPYQVAYARHINDELFQDPQTAGPLKADYLSGVFEGSRRDVVSLFYNGRCLLTLDPAIDPLNPTLDDYSAHSAQFSKRELILADTPQPARPDPLLFGAEPPHGWCYWYQQADLARLRGDWATVAQIGDAHLGDEPLVYKTVTTYIPFIEGYAHRNCWDRSLALSAQVNPVVTSVRTDGVDASKMLCLLWQRMASQTPATLEKTAALDKFHAAVSCK